MDQALAIRAKGVITRLHCEEESPDLQHLCAYLNDQPMRLGTIIQAATLGRGLCI